MFPVRLCPLPGALYTVLMGYKESPVAEARRRFGPMVRALADDFLAGHRPCLEAAAGGPFELALPVPSTARRGPAPLVLVEGLAETVTGRLPGARWVPGTLVRTAVPLGHMRPDARGFAGLDSDWSPGRRPRALLIDDTYVSGARAQSAAAALRRAGARAVVIVALGRVVRPDRVAGHAAFLHRQPAPAPGCCCRCVQSGASTE